MLLTYTDYTIYFICSPAQLLFTQDLLDAAVLRARSASSNGTKQLASGRVQEDTRVTKQGGEKSVKLTLEQKTLTIKKERKKKDTMRCTSHITYFSFFLYIASFLDIFPSCLSTLTYSAPQKQPLSLCSGNYTPTLTAQCMQITASQQLSNTTSLLSYPSLQWYHYILALPVLKMNQLQRP